MAPQTVDSKASLEESTGSVDFIDLPKGDLRRELPHGAYTRIANRLRPRVTAQHVREVALGYRRSARVERAIRTYRRRLQASEVSAA